MGITTIYTKEDSNFYGVRNLWFKIYH